MEARQTLTMLCGGLAWLPASAATSRSKTVLKIVETLGRLHTCGWTSSDIVAAMSEMPPPRRTVAPAGLLRSRLESLFGQTPPSVAREQAEQQQRAAQRDRERERARDDAARHAHRQACEDAQRARRAWLEQLPKHDRDRWWNALASLATTDQARARIAAVRDGDPCTAPIGLAHLFEAACAEARLDHRQLPPPDLDDPIEAVLLELP